MAIVKFYTNLSDGNVVNKEITIGALGTDVEFECDLVDDCSMKNPIIKINKQVDFNRVNYFYLETNIFTGWYFIDEPVTYRNGIYFVKGRWDLAYKWKDFIKSLYCYVKRYEFVNEIGNNDKYGLLIDKKIVSRIDRSIKMINLGSVGGNATGTHITLTTTGGVEE